MKNNMMNKTNKIFFALLLMSVSFVTVKAQQTDHEILQQFNQDYQEIVDMIQTAESMGDLRTAQDHVNQLLDEYRRHTAAINRAIYPETVGSRIEDLRLHFVSAQRKIRAIQQQDRSIDRLRSELSRMRDRLERYDDHILMLLARVSELEEMDVTVEEGMTADLREALRERDEFVTEFLTDLLERYEAVDADVQEEMTEIFERVAETPVDLIRTVLGEYINFSQQATDIEPAGLLNMKAQHVFFSEWWNKFGERLTNVFEPNEPVQARTEVEGLLFSWNSAIDNQLWGAISDAFDGQGIELVGFSSPQELYSALENYVSDQVQTAREQNSEEDLEHYRSFLEFWNRTFKSEWGDALTASGVLSHSQIAEIDYQLGDWSEAAVPVPANNLMLILFLISLAVIIGLIVTLVIREKRPSES